MPARRALYPRRLRQIRLQIRQLEQRRRFPGLARRDFAHLRQLLHRAQPPGRQRLRLLGIFGAAREPAARQRHRPVHACARSVARPKRRARVAPFQAFQPRPLRVQTRRAQRIVHLRIILFAPKPKNFKAVHPRAARGRVRKRPHALRRRTSLRFPQPLLKAQSAGDLFGPGPPAGPLERFFPRVAGIRRAQRGIIRMRGKPRAHGLGHAPYLLRQGRARHRRLPVSEWRDTQRARP